jgi:hypothetical protein
VIIPTKEVDEKMEKQIRAIFQSNGIDVPEEDYPILQEQWKWFLSLKEKTKEMEAGSYDIAMTYVVRGNGE